MNDNPSTKRDNLLKKLRELRRHIIRLAPVGSRLRVLIDEAIQIVIEDAK